MVLIIDDEKSAMLPVQRYLLKVGYSVKVIDDVDSAYKFIVNHGTFVDAIVLDIMMPHGDTFKSEEVDAGLTTGVMFLKKLKDELNFTKPILVFTALRRPNLLKAISKIPNCSAFEKAVSSAYNIAKALQDYGVPTKRPRFDSDE